MKRVTGIGGIFFKAKDPQRLRAWYERHLGLQSQGESGVMFEWRDAEHPDKTGQTVWSIFAQESKYFDPSSAPFMINYRVENLAGLLDQLRSEGVEVDERTEEHEYGRFGWVIDPEGNRIELWEPGTPFTKDEQGKG